MTRSWWCWGKFLVFYRRGYSRGTACGGEGACDWRNDQNGTNGVRYDNFVEQFQWPDLKIRENSDG